MNASELSEAIISSIGFGAALGSLCMITGMMIGAAWSSLLKVAMFDSEI